MSGLLNEVIIALLGSGTIAKMSMAIYLQPAIFAQQAIGELEAAIAELQGILRELGEEVSLYGRS